MSTNNSINEIISALDSLEQKADTSSIGEMIAKGIGVGIEQNSYLAITAMENVYVELETLYKNSEKNAQALQKKRQERELSNLKNSLNLNFITEQEYYERLREYRDQNLRQGSDDWYKYTEEIILYNKRMADELQKEQEALAQKLLSIRDKLSQKLSKDEDSWYTSRTTVIKGIGKNGTDAIYHNSDISDFGENISLIEQYRDAILSLKALGNIPDGIFSDIASMDTKDGLAAANAILNATNEERSRFVSGYNKRASLADSIANELTPVLSKEEIENLGVDASAAFNSGFFNSDSGSKSSFVQILEESFAEIPDSYYNLGSSSADSFGNGFMQSIPQIMEEIRSYMQSQINSIAEGITSTLHRSLQNGLQNGGNTYNNKYVFNTSRDTTTQQLFAAQRASTLSRLRGM